jgi:hypothetical protein
VLQCPRVQVSTYAGSGSATSSNGPLSKTVRISILSSSSLLLFRLHSVCRPEGCGLCNRRLFRHHVCLGVLFEHYTLIYILLVYVCCGLILQSCIVSLFNARPNIRQSTSLFMPQWCLSVLSSPTGITAFFYMHQRVH